jgi:desulfoferrodoxin (superoxide reductase-like protein)
MSTTKEKIPIKKKEFEVKHFETPEDFLKWNELYKDELKDFKINTLNKMINIPDYKSGLRNNHLTIIETKNKSKQNLRMSVKRLEL